MNSEICIRCGNFLDKQSSEFYRCVNCKRDYTKTRNNIIVDKWLSPISLVLYGIIFETSKIPDQTINFQIAQLEKFSKEEISIIINDIQEELDNPKQNVVEILDLNCGEENVRDYLQRLLVKIKENKSDLDV